LGLDLGVERVVRLKVRGIWGSVWKNKVEIYSFCLVNSISIFRKIANRK